MKRVIFILTALFIPIIIYAQGVWVPFTPSTPGEPPIIDVLESNNSRTVVHITIPGMYVEDTLIQGTTYHILSIPEQKIKCDIGAPQVPAIRELVAIPPISDVDVIMNICTPLVLNGYMVYPSQEPKPYGEPPGPFIIDTLIYSTNAFYPGKMAEKSDPAILKDMRVINTSCYPITFNPVTQQLNVYYDFIVELNYHGTNNINPLPHGYPSVVALMYEAMYKDLIINYDWLGISSERSSSWDYLVITATEYFDDLQDFVFWKHKKGCMIKVAKPVNIVFPRTYFIQDDTLAIKNYILNTFDVGATDKQFYVLFIGDEDAIPMCRYPTIYANAKNWSDHWYACLIGDDDYADIAIGRLSVANSSHVNTIINKIFAYERDPAQDWAIGRALMVSHYPDPPTSFHDTTVKIIDDFLVPNGFEYYDADGGGGDWTNASLKECIENSDPDHHGVGIINYFGHGDTAKWKEWNLSESFTTAEVNDLSNTNYYPIVYNCCCLNGAIQAEQEAMVEAWIRDPDGGGVGALGASVMAWAAQFWGANHIPG